MLTIHLSFIQAYNILFSLELCFGILATAGNYFHLMYSLPIFEMYSTMQSVIISVQTRYNQFVYTALLIAILITIYSSISFLYFKDLYFSSDLDENICNSFFRCFLSMFSLGIRSKGIGDFSGFHGFHETFYWGRY